MFVLGLALLLAVIGVVVFPCWRHSARWGYTPSTVAGVLLVLVALLVIGDRSLAAAHPFPEAPAVPRAAAPPSATGPHAPPTTQPNGAPPGRHPGSSPRR